MEGTPLGRYRLIELLGRGGMGEVWRAYDTATERLVALKVLPATLIDDQQFQQRFRREAKAAAGLDEPHVVPIYDYGEIDGRLYVTMRLVQGQDLQTLLNTGPLPAARAVHVIEQIASALHAAHRIELVHRDVKPSNILITDDDFAYLIDFGIARAAGETSLTNTGMTVGTWAYMAPERFRTGEVHATADIYALACVLFECLTGEPPFPIKSLEQVVAAHMMEPPPKPSQRRPGVPAAMDRVIEIGMAKDPEQRYPTTKELARVARAALSAPAAAPAETLLTSGPVGVATAVARPPEPPPTIAPDAGIGDSPTLHAPFAGQQYGAGARTPTPPVAPPSGPPGSSKRIGTPAKVALGIGAVALIGAVVAAIVANIPSPANRRPAPAGYSSQIELSFPGLGYPMNLAVDKSGDVYVAGSDSRGRAQLRKLAVGATTPTAVLITGLTAPLGLAFDSSGNLYIATDRSVLKVPMGSTTPTELFANDSSGFGGFSAAVAVDGAGNVYVCRNNLNDQAVLKIGSGSTTPVTLPFSGLKFPSGVAVDSAGDVYVTDYDENRVLKLPAGGTTAVELPVSGVNQPESVAVDDWGDVFVASDDQVLKIPANNAAATQLPFSGVSGPSSVAVDKDGNVYVVDGRYYLNSRVLKLPAS